MSVVRSETCIGWYDDDDECILYLSLHGAMFLKIQTTAVSQDMK